MEKGIALAPEPFFNIDEAYLYLGEQLRKRGLSPAGYVRLIALVAPYVGKEIDPHRYCSQFVLPVEEPA